MEKAERDMTDKFAVIDTETNWNDQVMSIGIVVADEENWKKIDSKYYIIDPEYRVGGMFSSERGSYYRQKAGFKRDQQVAGILPGEEAFCL